MDLKSTKQLAAFVALSDADRSRLEQLAAMAKLSVDDLWPDVWLYGFDDVEEGILADIEADEYFKFNAGIDNAEVMRQIKDLIVTQANRKQDGR